MSLKQILGLTPRKTREQELDKLKIKYGGDLINCPSDEFAAALGITRVNTDEYWTEDNY